MARNYGNPLGVLQDYQSKLDQANAANESRYQDILGRLEGRYSRNMARVGNWGRSAADDAVERSKEAMGAIQANLSGRGLGNFSNSEAFRQRNSRDLDGSLQQISEMRDARAAEYDQSLSKDIADFMERRTDKAPDMNQMLQLMQAYGAGGGSMDAAAAASGRKNRSANVGGGRRKQASRPFNRDEAAKAYMRNARAQLQEKLKAGSANVLDPQGMTRGPSEKQYQAPNSMNFRYGTTPNDQQVQEWVDRHGGNPYSTNPNDQRQYLQGGVSPFAAMAIAAGTQAGMAPLQGIANQFMQLPAAMANPIGNMMAQRAMQAQQRAMQAEQQAQQAQSGEQDAEPAATPNEQARRDRAQQRKADDRAALEERIQRRVYEQKLAANQQDKDAQLADAVAEEAAWQSQQRAAAQSQNQASLQALGNLGNAMAPGLAQAGQWLQGAAQDHRAEIQRQEQSREQARRNREESLQIALEDMRQQEEAAMQQTRARDAAVREESAAERARMLERANDLFESQAMENEAANAGRSVEDYLNEEAARRRAAVTDPRTLNQIARADVTSQPMEGNDDSPTRAFFRGLSQSRDELGPGASLRPFVEQYNDPSKQIEPEDLFWLAMEAGGAGVLGKGLGAGTRMASKAMPGLSAKLGKVADAGRKVANYKVPGLSADKVKEVAGKIADYVNNRMGPAVGRGVDQAMNAPGLRQAGGVIDNIGQAVDRRLPGGAERAAQEQARIIADAEAFVRQGYADQGLDVGRGSVSTYQPGAGSSQATSIPGAMSREQTPIYGYAQGAPEDVGNFQGFAFDETTAQPFSPYQAADTLGGGFDYYQPSQSFDAIGPAPGMPNIKLPESLAKMPPTQAGVIGNTQRVMSASKAKELGYGNPQDVTPARVEGRGKGSSKSVKAGNAAGWKQVDEAQTKATNRVKRQKTAAATKERKAAEKAAEDRQAESVKAGYAEFEANRPKGKAKEYKPPVSDASKLPSKYPKEPAPRTKKKVEYQAPAAKAPAKAPPAAAAPPKTKKTKWTKAELQAEDRAERLAQYEKEPPMPAKPTKRQQAAEAKAEARAEHRSQYAREYMEPPARSKAKAPLDNKAVEKAGDTVEQVLRGNSGNVDDAVKAIGRDKKASAEVQRLAKEHGLDVAGVVKAIQGRKGLSVKEALERAKKSKGK